MDIRNLTTGHKMDRRTKTLAPPTLFIFLRQKKLIKLLYLILFIFTQTAFGQMNSEKGKFKLYSRDCGAFYKQALTLENYKFQSEYNFEQNENSLTLLFYDFEDCIAKLTKQKEFFSSDSLYKPKLINSVVEIYFSNNISLTIAFDCKGNYLLNNKWHKQNYELTYALFKCFSKIIIDPKVLYKAEQERNKDLLWHDEE
jgi:hypothetical protein